MAEQRHEMTEKELAGFHESHMDDESLWRKPARTIRSRRGKGPSVTFSIRLTGDELTRIANAAFAQGTNPTDFIRTAALNAIDVSDEERVRGDELLKQVRTKIAELNAVVSKL